MDIVRTLWTYVVIVGAFLILAIGIALLVLPGPGWLIIIVGLTLLAGHFIWARRLLKEIKKEFYRAEEEILGVTPKKKKRS